MSEEFERGVREGELRATVAAHSDHLARINGSIDLLASSNNKLELAVREGFEGVREKMRSTEVDTRLAEARAMAVRETIASDVAKNEKRLSNRFTALKVVIPLVSAGVGFLIHLLGWG